MTVLRVIRDLAAGAVILSLLAAGAFTLLPARPPANLPPPDSVLDMHTHVAALGQGCASCFVSSDLTDSYKFAWYLRAFGTDAREMTARGDIAVAEHLRDHVRNSRFVARAVVLALDGVVDDDGALDREQTQIYVANDYVRDLARQFPEFVYGASINPYRRDALARLDAAKRDGAVLVKWIPAIMRIDPADPALDAFYDRLVALDIPLLVHVGDENAFHHADNALGDPVRLARPLERGVRVIAAHLATTGDNGGEENFTRLLPMFARYPRLLSEESSLTQLNKLGYLTRGLAHPGIAARLLHGSDWPLQFFPLVWAWWQAPRAPWAELRYAAGLADPLDRDIAIKAALGVPAAVFTRTATVLGVDLATPE
ncbi:MAG: amidohydrolase family protein [Gammaproteobacteria bacterium]